jgi:hypothetical protein
VEAIRQRRQPVELNTQTLLNRIDLPLAWKARFRALAIEQLFPAGSVIRFADSNSGSALAQRHEWSFADS